MAGQHIQRGTVTDPAYSFVDDTNTGFFSPAANTVALALNGVEVERWNAGVTYGRFVKATATITSAAAATAVNLIPDSAVAAGEKVYLLNFIARVNGTTGWGTTANVKIQDTNGTAVDFVTMLVAALTNQARVYPGTANTTSENAYSLGTGGTAAKGLQLKGDANGTGSDLVVTVFAWIGP